MGATGMDREYPEENDGGFQITADIRFKHGKLFLWMQKHDLSVAALSRMTGIPYPKAVKVVNMQALPNEKESAILEALTNIPSEELFPDEYKKVIRPGHKTKIQRRFVTKSIPLKEMLEWQRHEALTTPEEIVGEAETIELLNEAKNEILNERERRVIDMRFGVGGEEPKTLDEIGDIIGVHRERVRQIESKALEKLRYSNKMAAAHYSSR